MKKEQAQAATTGMTNRAWVKAFAQFQNISELDRRVLVALVDRILFTRTKRLRFNSNTGMNTSWRSAMSRNLKKGQLRLAEHRRIPWQEKAEKIAVSRNRQHRSGRCPMSLQSMHGCLWRTAENRTKALLSRTRLMFVRSMVAGCPYLRLAEVYADNGKNRHGF